MKKIYGNRQLVLTLANMVKCGRTANSVMFYGEKGSGRKMMAQFYTQLLLCENPGEEGPCGKCTACRNVEAGFHPDVMYVASSGKLGGYSVDTARDVCNDAYVKPNNSSGRKVYIFRDCRNMDTRTQNTLLKIIEEPPEYAFFIFTCEARSDFLPTIISRCSCFGLSLCTEEQSLAALRENGFSQEDAEAAVECFHGNIGRCIDYLTDESLRKNVDLTKSMADSIINKDEYRFNLDMCALGSDRNSVRNTLSLLDRLIRDAAVLAKDENARLIGCEKESAYRLAEMLTVHEAVRIHRCIEKTWKAVNTNVNIQLALAAFCGDVMNIL